MSKLPPPTFTLPDIPNIPTSEELNKLINENITDIPYDEIPSIKPSPLTIEIPKVRSPKKSRSLKKSPKKSPKKAKSPKKSPKAKSPNNSPKKID